MTDFVAAKTTELAEAAEQGADRTDGRAALKRQAVTDLRAEGLSVRDVGSILGVSPQRVSQLTR